MKYQPNKDLRMAKKARMWLTAFLLLLCMGLVLDQSQAQADLVPKIDQGATAQTDSGNQIFVPLISAGAASIGVDQLDPAPTNLVDEELETPAAHDPTALNPNGHNDEYWAELAKDEEPFIVTEEMVRAAAATNVGGQWGPVMNWPHIPVSAANLPDGKLLTFSGGDRTSWGLGHNTISAVWDPVTGSLNEIIANTGHNMFCAATVSLTDGRIMVNGSRFSEAKMSIFDGAATQWSRSDNMSNGRWYPTTIVLPDGDVFTSVGRGGGPYPEMWTEGSGWRTLTGINLQGPMINYTPFDGGRWWPNINLDPRGKLLHYGATPLMHSIDVQGNGTITELGPNNFDWFPTQSVAIQFDANRILIAGGEAQFGVSGTASDKAAVLDMSSPQPQITFIDPMSIARQHANEVMLPTGDVLVIGGNTTGVKYSDTGSALEPELWNPQTQQWTLLNPMSVPRNYHSTALLLPDGRVFAGGGGYNSRVVNPATDHPNAQVFSPPYLFDASGDLADRPVITSAPERVLVGSSFTIDTSEAIDRFTMIRLSATTHTMNAEMRFLEVDFAEIEVPESNRTYELSLIDNENILLPGYWMFFALNSAGVPSVSKIIDVGTPEPPPQGNGEGNIAVERWENV